MHTKQIKQAILNGLKVNWVHEGYEVQCNNNHWVIFCHLNKTCIGLTWLDNQTLNGEEEEFYIPEAENMYLSYFNDFITVRKFAEHYSLSNYVAHFVIDQGRKTNHSKFEA